MRRPRHPRPARAAALLLAAATAAGCGTQLHAIGRSGGVSASPGGGLRGVTGVGGAGPIGAGPIGAGPIGTPGTARVPGTAGVPGAGPRGDSTMLAGRRDRRAVALGGSDGVRRVCRSGQWPRGWAAVAYESGGDACPGRAAGDGRVSAANMAAVLVRVDRAPRGTRLDVCSDQPVPSRWTRTRDEAPADLDACPGAERGDRPGVWRIERIH